MALVVDHDDERVVAGFGEHGVGAERPFGQNLRGLCVFYRRNDDVLLFHAEETVFTCMRIKPRNGDTRRLNADLPEGAMRRVNYMAHPLTGDQVDRLAHADMEGRVDDTCGVVTDHQEGVVGVDAGLPGDEGRIAVEMDT